MVYATVDGSTWAAIDIGPIALASLTLTRGNMIRGSAAGVGEALDISGADVIASGDAWVARRIDIARHWMEVHPA
ncbi:MAG: hypothetical protein KKB67_08610, partial [Alphaproteobacteria bacterium]|nr:hypothetical protein [Alphaproteobacteria bacterium]